MSAFYKGQKVRVIRARNPDCAYALGMETVIVEKAIWLGQNNWMIEDRIRPETGAIAHIFGDDLEPLTPPHQPADTDFTERLNEQFREVFAPQRVEP